MSKPLIVHYKEQEVEVKITLGTIRKMKKEFNFDVFSLVAIEQPKGKNQKPTVRFNMEKLDTDVIIGLLYCVLAKPDETIEAFADNVSVLEIIEIIQELGAFVGENYDIKK